MRHGKESDAEEARIVLNIFHDNLTVAQRVRRLQFITRILVAGYTDATGDEKSNQQLSLRRAEAVRNWMLQTSDIPATCFAVEGSGIEPGTPGDYNVKAVHYGRLPGAKLKQEMMAFPVINSGEYNLKYQVKNTIGNFIPHARYLLVDESGKVSSGLTDEKGFTETIYTDKKQKISIHIVLDEEDGNDRS
ncbi:outer membrane lipoprotein [Escherichia coli]|nr:outer membrane lipoprotein [Escherichia coli]